MYCSKCRNKIENGSKYCIKCGNEIGYDKEFISENLFSDAVTTKELGLYVGIKKEEYYISKWLKFKQLGHSQYKSWNWAAFFLYFYWLAYRKMYIHAIGISGTFLIITEIIPDKFTRPLGIVLSIVLGLLGNKLYYNYSQKEIIKIKDTLPDLAGQEKAIENKVFENGTIDGYTVAAIDSSLASKL